MAGFFALLKGCFPLRKRSALLCILAAVTLCFCTALAGEKTQITVAEQEIALTGGSVRYPRLEGFADDGLADGINRQVLAAFDVEALLARLTLLGNSDVRLSTAYGYSESALAGMVFSCAFEAEGPVTDSRRTHVYSAANIDLYTGAVIGLDDLFVDTDAATAALESYMWDVVAPEMSAHLQNSDLTPLPDIFTVDAAGITFYYPIRQLSTLSDRAGAVTVLWCELLPHLKLGEGTILWRIGAEGMVTTAARETVEAALSGGNLPGIPVVLGGNMRDATDAYGMLADPDLYEDGRMFQLEHSAFRSVYLLTDALSEEWDNSVIRGIRADRMNLCGLMTGITTMDEWRACLGMPDATVTLDWERADAYRLEAGVSDYYTIGEYQLRLHAGEDGVLRSVFLIE